VKLTSLNLYGCRWSAIAIHLPGRSDNEIKNHWHTTLTKRTDSSSERSKKCNKKNSGSNIKRKSSVENQNASAKYNTHEKILLESSDWSPKESSSEELSFYQRDQHKLALEEISSGSFWTEPFEVDSFINSKIDFVAPSIDYYGLMSPPSPYIGHECISSFDFDHYNY